MVVCTSNQKVQLAIFLLQKSAKKWWETSGPKDDSSLTWEDFKAILFENYFPTALRAEKEAEFHAFRQGDLDEDEFIEQFSELSKYSTYLQKHEDTEWMAERLLEKARPDLREQLAPFEIKTFSEMCNKLRIVSRRKREARLEADRERRKEPHGKPPIHTRPIGGVEKRSSQIFGGFRNQKKKGYYHKGQSYRGNQSGSQGSYRSPATFNPTPSAASNQACSKCGKFHSGDCWVCYICQKPGHIARFCYQNQNRGNDQRPTVPARVYALSGPEAANNPNAIRGEEPRVTRTLLGENMEMDMVSLNHGPRRVSSVWSVGAFGPSLQVFLSTLSMEDVWTPPTNSHVRLNVDSFVKDQHHVACGGVIRNNKGEWVIGFHKNLGPCQSTNAEILAIKVGLEVCD
ncbi:uncharacterized protein LOC129299670 [Prosopis cineraria]|uniref:uncharacterized protein LOC129299670 n=1 Tax=Prosopis cineraria TaxID=364024 RepID=UPI00240F077B|nr:uncharacterized protein LOC129299670 [Prosopis cineraria]